MTPLETHAKHLAWIDALTPEQRLKALRAVVELESVEPTEAKTDVQFAIMTGYNDALVIMRAAIEKELG